MNLNFFCSSIVAALAVLVCTFLKIRYLKRRLESEMKTNAELSKSVIVLNRTLDIYRKEKAAREKNRDEADSKINSIDGGGIDTALAVLQDCGTQN